jgi:acyl-CoA synthetase (AMP-forming)/AMP-acid ligase II
MTIVDMVTRNARRFPNQLAFVEICPSKKFRRQMTWKEFDDRVNRLANVLSKMGLRKGDKVLHLMMNSINWLEAYFGVIKTGAIVVPLNFRFIGSQIKYCADTVEPKIFIFDDNFTERVVPLQSQLKTVNEYIFIGQDAPKSAREYEKLLIAAPVESVDAGLTGDDRCAVYFTSGTTGTPKATLLSHRNMSATAMHENYAHRDSSRDYFLLLQPLYHTGGKMHWFGFLIAGGRCTIVTGGEKITARLILETISRERITEVMLLVPWIQDLVTSMDKGEIKLEDYDVSCWKLMHSGAQPIPPSLIRHWKGWFMNVAYETHYGLTETAGPCIHLLPENLSRVGAIGFPVLELDARIVDEHNNDVPYGTVGEIILKGNNIMIGYYENPEETAKTLIDGWLHTGDLGKMDPDGCITFLDRKKDLVITGGENIYPWEIEKFFHSHPKVADATLIGIPDTRLGEVALAVIQPKEGSNLTEQEFRQYCESKLPKYQWPRAVIFDQVPRSPTGKIEKLKLKEKYNNYKWYK